MIDRDEELASLRERISKLEERNAKVEADKAFESSYIRIAAIALVTYVAMFAFMSYILIPSPHVSAIIPTLGFTISQLNVSWLQTGVERIGRWASGAWAWLHGVREELHSGGSTADLDC